MWNSATAWDYVTHNPFKGLVLPEKQETERRFFTVEEVQKIINKSCEPQKSLYWLAAETGMRAGELCGLRTADMDLGRCTVNVKQTVWRGKVQTPKTKNSVRQFAISPKLADHLREFLKTRKPNPLDLVFATKNGTPWDQNLVVKRKLHPLLKKLELEPCGLHAFRHTNASLMDRCNAPMKVRQERLGHDAGSDMTMFVYTHSVGEDDRTVARQLGELLRPDAPNLAENASEWRRGET
jgi:integrase